MLIDDLERARENRDYLNSLYGTIKGFGGEIRLSSPLALVCSTKVSLILGMNNLRNTSLHSKFNSICVFTDEENDRTFGSELAAFDPNKTKEWYNGQNWTGSNEL